MSTFYLNASDFLGKPDSFDWATIYAAIIGSVALLVGYFIQKAIERGSKNRENSKEAYLKFLNDFSDTTVEEIIHDDYYHDLPRIEQKKYEIESLRKKLHARNLMLLHGSDKVVTAYLNFIKHIDNVRQNHVEDQQEQYFNKLLSSMRREAYNRSKISDADIQQYFNEFIRQ